MSDVKLFSARACPYAHRTRLVLAEKQIQFELIEIDLQNKPNWFDSKISAYGKVPALQHGDVHLWESSVVNEYLEEVFPTPALLPREPAARALARIWLDYANTRFTAAFGTSLRAQDATVQSNAQRELSSVLAFIEHEGLGKLSGAGPFFLGHTPSLLDFSFYPWFERWPALAHYRGIEVPTSHQRTSRWLAALRELPSVVSHHNDAAYYIERYARHVAPAQAVA